MQAQREATDAKVESLLTPEQAAKFAHMKKKQGHQGHGNRHDGRQDGKRAPRHDGGCCCKDK
jgi:Spy/CpxP family protein refolding chaperone